MTSLEEPNAAEVEAAIHAHVLEEDPGAELVAKVKPPPTEEALEALFAWAEATYPGEVSSAGSREWLSIYVSPTEPD